jgi:hypothetical protein
MRNTETIPGIDGWMDGGWELRRMKWSGEFNYDIL